MSARIPSLIVTRLPDGVYLAPNGHRPRQGNVTPVRSPLPEMPRGCLWQVQGNRARLLIQHSPEWKRR
jgi:hypothetical protein